MGARNSLKSDASPSLARSLVSSEKHVHVLERRLRYAVDSYHIFLKMSFKLELLASRLQPLQRAPV